MTDDTKNLPSHVDDFVHTHGGDPYARWVLMHFRLPAAMMLDFRPFMERHRLFCTYRGERYRVTGASRMGDVWLAEDFERVDGYDHRVDVDDCSDWGPKPYGTGAMAVASDLIEQFCVPSTRSVEAIAESLSEVAALLKIGQKIQAIRALRMESGLDLKASKDAVEGIIADAIKNGDL